MRRLPPLSALRAFEAAARHGSFKRAAEELGVTPTAISHRIRALEEHVGVSLFERRTRQVVLTVEGEALYPVLRDGFDAFAQAIGRLMISRSRLRVTIAATPAFTSKWLVPRVALFQQAHPDIDLQFHASNQVVDLAAGTADLAIRYGHGPYPGLISEPLLADRFAPVANPSLAIRTSEDLRRASLLHFEWTRADPANPTWALWFRAAGIEPPSTAPQVTFSDEGHAIQAAVAGQGVALLSLVLVADELTAGNLVQPFAHTIGGMTYHLVEPGDRPRTFQVERVRGWLLSEIASTRGKEIPRSRSM
jgi:LysR family transcriptional regulator, glycine cleavage system transcriptional activator